MVSPVKKAKMEMLHGNPAKRTFNEMLISLDPNTNSGAKMVDLKKAWAQSTYGDTQMIGNSEEKSVFSGRERGPMSVQDEDDDAFSQVKGMH